MNLNPLVSSKRLPAFISPRLPSLIRSLRERPLFWYCFATETTNRRFAFVSFSNAIESPCLILRARSTSSSEVIKLTFPISCRYFSRDWLSRFVICLLIFSCFISDRIWVCLFEFLYLVDKGIDIHTCAH